MKTRTIRSARWWAVFLVSALIAALIAVPVSADSHDPFTLTILHNNDGESALLPSGDEAGVARFATALKRAKRTALRQGDGFIMVSSGDNFLASPEFTASLADGVFYDALALDMLRYDAIDLGNHDFDFGPDVLAAFIGDFRRPGQPPYLSSNLDFRREPALQAYVDAGAIAKSTVISEADELIGIIGATTENLPFISSPREVVVNAVLPAVRAEVAKLEAMGIDKIVFISHLQDIDGDVMLAEGLSGVDVMIAGGGDELLANPDDLLLPSDEPDDVFGPYPIVATDSDGVAVPVVTTSGQYGYLGRLVVDFDADGNVTGWDGGPIRIVSPAVGRDGVPADSRMQRVVVDPVALFVADLATNVIATSEVDLDGQRDSVRFMETNEGNLIADSQLWQANQLAAAFGVGEADVALQNGGGIRNDSVIPAGDITELNTFEMVPFGNFVTIMEGVDRQVFKDLLENAVSRIDPAATTGGTGRFAQVAGFSFVFDTTGTAALIEDGVLTIPGTRVTDVVLDDGTVIVAGGAVVAGDDINVAVVDFTARGGDEYQWGDGEFTALGVSYQQALFNYLTADGADGGLGGVITAADYPEGGEGRITQLP